MEDLSGMQLGAYRIVAQVGKGGMAVVYKAYQASMDRYVAVKVLPRDMAADPQFTGRFENEARVVARLQHPHILPVFDYGQSEGYTYFVMPLIETGTLAQMLRGKPLPVDELCTYVMEIGEALEYAHARGLLHRDIKPSNVLIDESGHCLLTDFGIAKLVDRVSNLTATGTLIGTPAYMSPEQGRGQELDRRSDIYSLGIILYELA
ncbi:MAG: serine/threonine protein kinase, partial [Anaerolineales bacterium]|nr:serine/threonine protein kinase [Anaerolineales bacterium]